MCPSGWNFNNRLRGFTVKLPGRLEQTKDWEFKSKQPDYNTYVDFFFYCQIVPNMTALSLFLNLLIKMCKIKNVLGKTCALGSSQWESRSILCLCQRVCRCVCVCSSYVPEAARSCPASCLCPNQTANSFKSHVSNMGSRASVRWAADMC